MTNAKEHLEMLRALRVMNNRGYLAAMINPEIEASVKVESDSFTDFDLMTDDERKERIRTVLTRFLSVNPQHDHRDRHAELVQYRQLFAYLLKRYTCYTWGQIGEFMGRKNHATAIHAHKTIKNAIEWDKGYAVKVERIIDEL